MNYPTSWSPNREYNKETIKNYLWVVLKALKLAFAPSLYTVCLQLHAFWIIPWALIPYYVLRAAKKAAFTFWSTSKLRTLNSIFTFEHRFLWKAQSILKSWMDTLKVIYSWLIFRDQKKYPIQEYFSDLLKHYLIRTLIEFSFTQFLPFLRSSLVEWNVTGHVELCSSATRIEMIYFYGKTASWDGLFPAEPFAVMDDTRNSNTLWIWRLLGINWIFYSTSFQPYPYFSLSSLTSRQENDTFP